MVINSSHTVVRDLALTVFGANGRLVDTGNELVRSAGLTTAWWQVLAAVGYSPHPLPVSHIARNMGLTRQAVQRVVNLLIANGLVDQRPNPHHQRSRLIGLTPIGRDALGRAEALAAPLDVAILDRIGAERLAEAIAVLREMNDVIDESLSATANPAAPSTSKDIA